jgi:integrase
MTIDLTETPRRSTPGNDTITFMTELIDRYLTHCEAAGLAATTIDKRSELLRRLDRGLDMGLGQATTEELEHFLARCRAPETKASYYGHICGFFRWACDPRNPRIDYDPTSALTRPRVRRGVPKPVTDAEVAMALQTLPQPWLTWVALATYEGARCIEIVRADRADVTPETTRLRGKGGGVRVLKTHAEVWRIVEPMPAGPLALRVDGRRADAEYLSSSARQKFERSGLPGVTLHRFRHWYATTQLRPVRFGGAGASIRTVQRNLGHESLQSTAIYTFASEEERADAIDSLPTFRTPSSS